MKHVSILILPQPKLANTSLHSWNLLAMYKPLQTIKNKEQLIIYTGKSVEDVKNVADYAKEIGFEHVYIHANLENYVTTSETYLSDLQKLTSQIENDDVIIDNVFFTMNSIEPGVQSWAENNAIIDNALNDMIENANYSGKYVQHAVYGSILGILLSNDYKPMIDYFIVDPVEVDITVYLPEFCHYMIRRHFVHPIMDRPSVQVNRFIVEPFFDKSSPFYADSSSIELEKSLSFVFGLTAYDDIRKNFIVDLKNVLTEGELYYCYKDDNGEMIDTRLKYEDYLQRLNKGKTTLLIPSYDPNSFSMHRFVEAIAGGCLPIIFEAFYEIGFVAYPDTLLLISKYLVLDDIANINTKIQEVAENHQQIYTELLNSSYFTSLKTN